MDNKLVLKLQHILTEEQQELSRMKSELSALPKESRLVIRTGSGRKFFYEASKGKERGISREPELVARLARKAFLEKSVSEKMKNISIISCMLKRVEGNDKTGELSEFILSSGYLPQIRKWLDEPFDTNPLYPENLKYCTDRGIRMRSKSERTIGSRLEKYNVTYKYERAMDLSGMRVYPDFTIMKHDGHMVIWEHLGLAENPLYMAKNMNKVSIYQKHGFRTHKNLILTVEEDLESPESLDRIIERYLL